MSRTAGNKFIIEPENPGICEYCGKTAELRPYGRNGANICYLCGMKNLEETERQFEKATKDAEQIEATNTRTITIMIIQDLGGNHG